MLDRLLFSHPRALGESYGQHLRTALGFGAALFMAGLACSLHGLVPALFPSTGSRAVKRLHDAMWVERTQRSSTPKAH